MKRFPKSLTNKLNKRIADFSLRQLSASNGLVDFASNDYLGFAQSESIFNETHQFLINRNLKNNGATGSRLISGNHPLYEEAENRLAAFHQSESALIFNSGYDANLGIFSSVPQKGDFILYDELCHASIRDGIKLSNAKSYKFRHNDYEDLERLVQNCHTEHSRSAPHTQSIYIATESVFSMDGDTPDFTELLRISEKYDCHIIVDEAHALGVFGEKGEGFIQNANLQNKIFARIVTFGKGLGCHGAAVLGSTELKKYLINFARSFIYTTGLPPHSVAAILTAYDHLESDKEAMHSLRNNINFFNRQKKILGIDALFVRSKSAIQCAIIPGNEAIKNTAAQLQQNGFDVKAILSPTVPEGQERLRICLHSYNSEQEISDVLQLLRTFAQ